MESQADQIVRPVIVKLTKEAMIFRRERGLLRQVDISEVYFEDQAELWLIGPVPSSFPAEVNARQVIVDRGAWWGGQRIASQFYTRIEIIKAIRG